MKSRHKICLISVRTRVLMSVINLPPVTCRLSTQSISWNMLANKQMNIQPQRTKEGECIKSYVEDILLTHLKQAPSKSIL